MEGILMGISGGMMEILKVNDSESGEGVKPESVETFYSGSFGERKLNLNW